ncbi:hypothetical protein FPQ18DRAFT_416135 [Pyronema domesticum]|nr:hypothetical protein FPQ18DRAFT_416135 [Pyronema domesticum]
MEYLQDYSNEGAHSPRGGEPCEDRTAETKTTVLHAMHSTQRDFKASYPGVSSKGSIHSERLIAEMFINCRKSWGRSLATMIRLSRYIEKMNKKEVKPEKGEPSASEELAKFLKASIKKYLEEFGGSNQAIPIVLSPNLETIPFWPSKQYPKTLDSPGQQCDSIQALGQESLSDNTSVYPGDKSPLDTKVAAKDKLPGSTPSDRDPGSSRKSQSTDPKKPFEDLQQHIEGASVVEGSKSFKRF